MAIYHLSSQIIKRATGRSSVAAAAYRAGAKLHDERTGLTHDYRHKSGCDEAIILTPTHAPQWMLNREQLWNAVEQKEKRKDAQVAREIDVALPVELTPKQMKTLMRAYVKEQFVDSGMVADVAFHHLGGHNPHCHIMLTLREIAGDGFGLKNREWNDKAQLKRWRESWAQHVNRALAEAQHYARVDHRTLKAQGIARVATEHLGTTVNQMLKKGHIPDRAIPTLIQRVQAKLLTVQQELKRVTAAILAYTKGQRTEKQQAHAQSLSVIKKPGVSMR